MDLPFGELLLFAICAFPYDDDGLRIPVLDAAASRISLDTLHDIPPAGFTPAELRERLGGTPYAAAADFGDWLWGETESVFLDVDDEVEIVDAEWTREVVFDLADQWQKAKALLERIGTLTTWLEADPPDHFAQLLDAALGRDVHTAYLRERRFYDLEITEHGLVAIQHEDNDAIALPQSVAA